MFCGIFVFALLGVHLGLWISGSAAGVSTFSYAKDGWPHFPYTHGSHHSARGGGKVGGGGDDGSTSFEFQANFEFQKDRFTVPHDSKIPDKFYPAVIFAVTVGVFDSALCSPRSHFVGAPILPRRLVCQPRP